MLSTVTQAAINARGELISRNKNGYPCVLFSDRKPDFFPHALKEINRAGDLIRDEFGPQIMMMYGALLGPIREGDFIPHDDDFDLCYVSERDSPDAICEEAVAIAEYMRGQGYKVSMASFGFMQIGKGDVRFDLFVGWRAPDGLFRLYWGVPVGIPMDSVLPLNSMEIHGVDVKVPAKPEVILAEIYGKEWRTPDPAFRYTKDVRFHSNFSFLIKGWPKEAGKAYWNAAYREKPIPRFPSQFAVSVLPDIPRGARLLDIGCGNGRDAMFFASHDLQVVGADASSAAIDAGKKANTGAEFELLDIYRPNSMEPFMAEHKGSFDAIYARFFIHAIDQGGEGNFWQIASKCLSSDGRVYVEARTVEDQANHHGTAISEHEIITDHYRRFIVPKEMHAKANKVGLALEYEAIGRGMAKYKDEDPPVIRAIYRRA